MSVTASTHLRPKNIRKVLLAINIIAVIPILIISFFNVPAADDFSMAFEVHEAYDSSGSVLNAIGEAIYMGYWYYMNWTGYFFSDALTALCPGVFGEGLYFLGTIVVLISFSVGIWYFLRSLLVRILGMDKDIAGCITGVVYFLILHCMPEGGARCESFFWYSGAINYMFMFGMSLLWIGGILSAASQNIAWYRKALLCIFGFLLGGANYLTGLTLAILSFCILFISIYSKILESRGKRAEENTLWNVIPSVCLRLSGLRTVILPSVFMLTGFIFAVVAPGNKNRETAAIFGPLKSIMIAVYYSLRNMFGEWISWQTVCLILLLVPIMWVAAGHLKSGYSFDHPILFMLFSFLLSAASITPPLYATGNIEAGRIYGIYFAKSMLLLVLMEGYLVGYFRCRYSECDRNEPDKEIRFDDIQVRTILCLAVIFIIGSMLSVKVNPHIYTGTSAAYDILNGSAAEYKREFDDRLAVLKDSGNDDVELLPFSTRPALLFFSDITTDKNDWLNKALASYYHKKSVIIVKE